MCGLAGWFDRGEGSRSGAAPPPGEDARRAALDALIERGPDGEGAWVSHDGRAGLLHRRLAVVDVEGGAQPMPGPAPGQVLAWNGELFDHRERRAALEAAGERFASRSDTEIVARLLADTGPDCLPDLRAQYALAWIARDARGPTLLLARDRAGEKPLFWTEVGDRVFFASTLDALRVLAGDGIASDVDPEALSLYLSWGFVPAPLTIFRGVSKLAAGTSLSIAGDGSLTHGTLPAPPSHDPIEPGAEVATLREALRDAARIRLTSADVPVGVFLSAGLDSLAVTAALRGTPGLRTFTVRARDPAVDESADAAAAARLLGVEHEIIDPPPEDPADWRRALLRYGEPFAAPSAVAVDGLARAARRHVTVALTGDGGDEALGGYPRHVMLQRLGKVPRLPVGRLAAGLPSRRLRRAAELSSYGPAGRYAAMYEVFGPWRERIVPGDDAAPARSRIAAVWGTARADDLTAMLRVDRTLELPDAHCVKVDVACMGNGLEPRSPWLDPRVVAACDALPAEFRSPGADTKVALRRLLAEDLPGAEGARLLALPKRGFSTGFETALASGSAEDLLFGGALDRLPTIRSGGVRAILDEHRSGRGNHLFRLMVLVALALFAEARLR